MTTPGVVPVAFKTILLPSDDDNVVPVETVEVDAPGVVKVHETAAGPNVVPVYETAVVTPRTRVLKV